MIEAGKRYLITKTVRGVAEKPFPALVASVEDRGDFWYIGYQPDDTRLGQFGYFRIKKNGLYGAINYSLKAIAEEGKK